MSGFLKLPLSNASMVAGVPLAVPIAAGVVVAHTAPPAGSGTDEVWMWAFGNGYTGNIHSISVVIGGQTMNVVVGGNLGLLCVLPGIIVLNGTTVSVYADVVSVIWIVGFVNRILQ